MLGCGDVAVAIAVWSAHEVFETRYFLGNAAQMKKKDYCMISKDSFAGQVKNIIIVASKSVKMKELGQ